MGRNKVDVEEFAETRKQLEKSGAISTDNGTHFVLSIVVEMVMNRVWGFQVEYVVVWSRGPGLDAVLPVVDISRILKMPEPAGSRWFRVFRRIRRLRHGAAAYGTGVQASGAWRVSCSAGVVSRRSVMG